MLLLNTKVTFAQSKNVTEFFKETFPNNLYWFSEKPVPSIKTDIFTDTINRKEVKYPDERRVLYSRTITNSIIFLIPNYDCACSFSVEGKIKTVFCSRLPTEEEKSQGKGEVTWFLKEGTPEWTKVIERFCQSFPHLSKFTNL